MAYTINLKNGQRLDMEVYLAFDQPELLDEGPEPDLDARKFYQGMHLQSPQGFRWPAVRRSRCAKGCLVSSRTGPTFLHCRPYCRPHERAYPLQQI